MRTRSISTCSLICLAICALTVGATRAKADSVGLSDGQNVSGSTAFIVFPGGGINIDNAVTWKFTSTVVPFPASNPASTQPIWTNSNNLGLAVADLSGPAGAYTLFGITNNTLDFSGSGIQSQLTFACGNVQPVCVTAEWLASRTIHTTLATNGEWGWLCRRRLLRGNRLVGLKRRLGKPANRVYRRVSVYHDYQ